MNKLIHSNYHRNTYILKTDLFFGSLVGKLYIKALLQLIKHKVCGQHANKAQGEAKCFISIKALH